MELGFSGKAFGNLILLLGFLMFIAMFAIKAMAKKRGINTSSPRFQLKLVIYCSIVFLIIPTFFSNFPLEFKIIISIAVLAAVIADFFAIVMGRKYLKDRFENDSE